MKRKYKFTQFREVNKNNTAIRWVGKAHSKLKLFLHMRWLVPNHIKIIKRPNNPHIEKKKTSKAFRKILPAGNLKNVRATINKNTKPRTTKGVKNGIVFFGPAAGSNSFFSVTKAD